MRHMKRPMALGLALVAVIACGLSLRIFGYSLHLPFVVVKYGGSALWAAMVYVLLALVFSDRRPVHIAAVAIVVAVGVEFLRLFHTPWLDEFRLTLTGALLLGRIFSLWNIAAYIVGIATAFALDMIFGTRDRNASVPASH
ncbi:uncharacterized protein DUF2809 [Rhizobium sp. BK376]|nr:uncharacterized protein DUF2809 [Rhizobium sp. BK376]